MRGETFVVRDRVYEIRVMPQEDQLSTLVTVNLDGRFEWSIEGSSSPSVVPYNPAWTP